MKTIINQTAVNGIMRYVSSLYDYTGKTFNCYISAVTTSIVSMYGVTPEETKKILSYYFNSAPGPEVVEIMNPIRVYTNDICIKYTIYQNGRFESELNNTRCYNKHLFLKYFDRPFMITHDNSYLFQRCI